MFWKERDGRLFPKASVIFLIDFQSSFQFCLLSTKATDRFSEVSQFNISVVLGKCRTYNLGGDTCADLASLLLAFLVFEERR